MEKKNALTVKENVWTVKEKDRELSTYIQNIIRFFISFSYCTFSFVIMGKNLYFCLKRQFYKEKLQYGK